MLNHLFTWIFFIIFPFEDPVTQLENLWFAGLATNSGNRAGLQIRPMIKFEPDAMCLQINARYRALYDVVGNIKYMLSRLLEQLAPKSGMTPKSGMSPKSGTSPGAKWAGGSEDVSLD